MEGEHRRRQIDKHKRNYKYEKKRQRKKVRIGEETHPQLPLQDPSFGRPPSSQDPIFMAAIMTHLEILSFDTVIVVSFYSLSETS